MSRKLSVFSCIILVIAMTFAMAACGEKGGNEEPVAKDVALDTIYQTIYDACKAQSNEDFPLWQETDEGFLSQMYEGLFDYEFEDTLFYQHFVVGTGCEITILKLKDANDVNAVIDVCNKRIEIGSEDDFYPDHAGTWKNNSTVLNYGNYVILICMPESITLPEDEVEALFK